jgi:hypothetical protein
MRKSKQVTLSLDPAILAKIDEERGLIPRSRYIAYIIESWFGHKREEEKAGVSAPEEAPPARGGYPPSGGETP